MAASEVVEQAVDRRTSSDSLAGGGTASDSLAYYWLVQDPNVFSGTSSTASTKWLPLRRRDSDRLETAWRAKGTAPIAVYSGRYDVDLQKRIMKAVYWKETDRAIMRSSWFFGEGADRQPYEEDDAEALEKGFQRALAGRARLPLLVPVSKGQQDVRFEASRKEDNGGGWFASSSSDTTNPSVETIYESQDGWQYFAVQESVDRSVPQPFVPVWRGFDVDSAGQSKDDEEELLPQNVECLVFVVHGIGQFHRNMQDTENTEQKRFYRDVSKVRRQSVSYLRNRMDAGHELKGRLEFLPLEWFESIHIEEGVGQRLQNATLPSVPSLRQFANFALADILVYQDDDWREQILTELYNKMVQLWNLFTKRTPDYTREIAILAHSLGSVIMFDLVQRITPKLREGFLSETTFNSADTPSLPSTFSTRFASPTRAASGQSSPEPDSPARNGITSKAEVLDGDIKNGKDKKEGSRDDADESSEHCPMPRCFFSVGSPLGMFQSIRLSRKKLHAHTFFKGLDVRWPASCMGAGWRFFNIFHPDDPIAYRMEPLLNPSYAKKNPVVIPHLGGLRWNSQVQNWWGKIRSSVVHTHADADGDATAQDVLLVNALQDTPASASSFIFDDTPAKGPHGVSLDRIDYALQVGALESLQEYISAINSHYLYWDNEDLIHFMVDQCFETLGRNLQRPAAPPPACMPAGVAW